MKVFIGYILALLFIAHCTAQEVMDEQNRFYIVGDALREVARLEDKQMKRYGNNYQEIIENWYLVKAHKALTDSPSLIPSSHFGWSVASLLVRYAGNPTVINFLLNAGVSAEPAGGGSPLHYIPLNKEIPDRYIMQSVQRLLDAGADVNYQLWDTKKTPLMYKLDIIDPLNAHRFLTMVKLCVSKNIIEYPASYFSLLPPKLKEYIKSRYSLLDVGISDGRRTLLDVIKDKKKEWKNQRKTITDKKERKQLRKGRHELQNALDILEKYKLRQQ